MVSKVYLYNVTESKWTKNCMKMVYDSGIKVKVMNRGRSKAVFDWRMIYKCNESLKQNDR